MSPRKPAVLRDGDGQNLRDYLIATAARMIDERGSAGLGVRDIAREAQVADGVLYNYFEDKEDLLAHALLAVADNLRLFIDTGLATLARVVPAFAGLLSQPKVLARFHAMVGGDAAFAGEAAVGGEPAPSGDGPGEDSPGEDGPGEDGSEEDGPGGGPAGLPDILARYLHAEQRLGRIDQAADIDAAVTLVVGAIHGQVLPRVLFSPPGSRITAPPDLAGRLAETVLGGIGPRAPRS
jgi:AcrR family transcriptional regulator